MPKQLEFKGTKGRGGKRRGAGRPNLSGCVGHAKRVNVNFKAPLHLTLRLHENMPRLRTSGFLKEFKKATRAAREFGLRVVHYSIQGNHIHLVAEAADNTALARGMKSLCGRLGKIIRGLVGGVGAVWKGRFHLHQLKTPTEVRNALRYVLLNFSKHGNLIEHLDDFSSGYGFKHWGKLLRKRHLNGLMADQIALKPEAPLETAPPLSWLLRIGWTRA